MFQTVLVSILALAAAVYLARYIYRNVTHKGDCCDSSGKCKNPNSSDVCSNCPLASSCKTKKLKNK